MTRREEPLWRRYLRFFGPDVDADIDDELAHHLALSEAEYVAQGMTPGRARAAARERFGDVAAVRRALRRRDAKRLKRENRARWFDELGHDVRYGLRALWSQRSFTISAVLTLALGIGATTAMFSAVDAALLRPLPFHEPERLVYLSGVQIPFAPRGTELPSELPNLRTFGELPVFSHVAAYAAGGLNLTGGDEPERVRVGSVTHTFFTTLGVRPEAGRAFTPAEGVPGGPKAVILANALAQRQFGGVEAVGRSVQLNDISYQVVGVMPAGFGFPERSDLWIPLTVPTTFESFAPFRGYLPTRVVARLADGASLEGAASRIRALWLTVPERLRANVNLTGEPLEPLQRQLVGTRRTALLVLLGATGLLLLIACTNVTSLLLARGARRRRELALRAALGASRGRLARQLLIESLVLALSGAGAGLVVAAAGLGVVRALLPQGMQDLAAVTLDLRVFAFAIGLALATGLAFGMWPAFGAARADPADTMKSGGLGSTRHGTRRLARVLVAGELAVALTLLIGAGLLLRSFHELVTLDAGFRTDRVATLELAMSRAPMSRRLAVLDGVLQRLGATPGVEAAGVINDLPLGPVPGIALNLRPEGRPPEWNADGPFARMLFASPGFFRALDIPLLRGRLMRPSDDSLAPHVVVINATMAQQYWPGEDALGKRMNDFGGPGEVQRFRTVVGVVADVREGGLEREPMPQMYFPIYEAPPANAALVVRGALPAQELFTAMRAAVRELDPNQPVYNVRTMDDVRSASLAVRRTNTTLITAFGAVALLLAMIGVYGVAAYSVAQRGREMGIRAALGATRADLVRLVMLEGGAMALAGVAAGLGGAWAFARALRSLLYGVEPSDSATFIAAAAALAALALAATIAPARRAARANPVEVIRAE